MNRVNRSVGFTPREHFRSHKRNLLLSVSLAFALVGLAGLVLAPIDEAYLNSKFWYIILPVICVGIFSNILISRSATKSKGQVVLIVVGALLVTAGIYASRTDSELHENGRMTMGRVVEINMSKSKWTVRYQFTLDGTLHFGAWYSDKAPADLHVGDSISVRYSINCPNLHVLLRE